MTLTKPKSKGGRPRQSQAGEVERRLLDAALQCFLSYGFEGASCEDIARAAGASKATLYARYANKEALFEAVVQRHVVTLLMPAEAIPALALEGRLRHVGQGMLEHALQPGTLAMMRLVIATANRAPALAAEVNRMGWEGGFSRVLAAIEAGPDQPAEADALARQFVDLVFAPHQLRAVLGEDRAQLVHTIPERVEWGLKLVKAAGLLH
ncbi:MULTISPECIES: TetR/AcrR family transcriptional regulator [Pseudomonas]|uniref:TetR/AcrR family transcriptional regulator n=1 Tax=Pseudomonas quercus TaxID=2722792 RepID=A0ABX0YFT3_9PSED|nr:MULTISPECIES: TetR/AcrR family transcriptional regulator [Pseudomonas]MBF7143615.1 TetR/AcrR family transcriptional regulator [Pseudomonas sp. LY10J]NJP02281.1 TetR/AcrR family transcriptional regulator [Pseudomonas quercus]